MSLEDKEQEFIGKRIGRFQIEGILGRGGMGVVYKGRDEMLGRPVALKALGEKHRMSPILKGRFFREAQILSSLDHPNICRIYDLMEVGSFDFLVLEFIRGKTLKTCLKDKSLSRAEKLQIALQIIDALAAAHAENIIHRDLKPDNIMLTEKGEVKILDFGLARHGDDTYAGMSPEPYRLPDDHDETTLSAGISQDSVTTYGSIVGTAYYMSPEQARGEPIGPESDIYSLGIVLLEMFTEKTVYDRKHNIPTIVFMVGKGERPQPRELDPNIDPDLEALINRLAAFQTYQRPNAEEVKQQVQALIDEPKRRRGRTFRALGLTGFLVILILAVTATWWFGQTKPWISGDETTQRIAVLPVGNLTGNDQFDWVSFGLQRVLSDQLSEVPRFYLADVSRVREEVAALDAQPNGTYTPTQIQQLSKRLAGDLMIQVNLRQAANHFQFDIEVFKGEKRLGSESLLTQQPAQSFHHIGEKIVSRLLPPERAADLQLKTGGLSNDPDVNLIYAMGFQRSEAAGPRAALPYFKVCLDRDPSFHAAGLDLARCYMDMSDLSAAEAQAQKLIPELKQSENNVLLCKTLILLGDIAGQGDHHEAALNYYAEAQHLAESFSAPSLLADALVSQGFILEQTGRDQEAKLLLDKALAIFQEVGDNEGEADAHRFLGMLARNRRDIERARNHFNKALALHQTAGRTQKTGALLGDMGSLLIREHRFEEAVTTYLDAKHHFDQIGSRLYASYSLLNAVMGAESGGDLDRAEALAESFQEEYQDLENLTIRATFAKISGNFATRKKQREKAETYYYQSLDYYQQLNQANKIAEVHTNLAGLLLGAERYDEVAEHLTYAREYYEDTNHTLLLHISDYLESQNKTNQAFAYLNLAKSVAGDLWTIEDEEKLCEISLNIQ